VNFFQSAKNGLFSKKFILFAGAIFFLNWLLLFFDIYLWEFSFSWFIMILLAPLLGFIGLYFVSFFLYGICRVLMHGNASFKRILTLYSWSQLPLLINVGMWIILLIFDFRGGVVQKIGGIAPFMFINLVMIISFFWSLLLLIHGIKISENFSFLKTCGAILLLLPVYVFTVFFYNFISVFTFVLIFIL